MSLGRLSFRAVLLPYLGLALGFASLGQADDRPWTLHTIDDSSRGADGVRLADVNGDGWQDVATGWEEGGRVRVYVNPGPGQAKRRWPAVTVGRVKSPEDAVLVDLDGDGATDVVSCCEGRTRTIFVHWAPREPDRYLDPTAWETEILPHSENHALWMFCEPMQVDGQRGVDLVVGSKGSGATVGWYESPEHPRDLAAWTWHRIVPAGWIMTLREIRLGPDRNALLFSDRKGSRRGVHVAPIPKAPSREWRTTRVGGDDREVMFLAAAPVDDSDRPEIVASVRGRGLTWFTPNPDGSTWDVTEIPLPANTGTGKGVALADVDLDGRTDVLFTCENARGKHGVMWLRRQPTGEDSEWAPHAISGAERGVKFDRVEMLDLDADGDLDLLTCEERDNLGVIWYENPTR